MVFPVRSLISPLKTQLRLPTVLKYFFLTHLAPLFGCRLLAHLHSAMNTIRSTYLNVYLLHTCRWGSAQALLSAFICFLSLAGFSSSLVTKDLVEVCSLSCWVSPLLCGPILPITGRPSLFPSSLARCSVRLHYGFPAFLKAGHRVFHVPFNPLDRLGPLCSPAASDHSPLAHDKEYYKPCFLWLPFWLKSLACIFSLSPVAGFIKRSHLLTILSTLALSPRCFQGANPPRSFCTNFRCRYFVQSASQDEVALLP